LKRIINRIQKFSKEWNVKEIKIVVFKKEGKLGKSRTLRLGSNEREVKILNI
jgi:hypothetical protein